jgi:hypothetical protein
VPSSRELVSKSEFLLDDGEISNHWDRRVGLTTSTAQRLSLARASILIEADPKLCRSLKNVKQFAEWQP